MKTPIHRRLVLGACLLFACALAAPRSAAAEPAGDLAQARAAAPQFVCNQVTAFWFAACRDSHMSAM